MKKNIEESYKWVIACYKDKIARLEEELKKKEKYIEHLETLIKGEL